MGGAKALAGGWLAAVLIAMIVAAPPALSGERMPKANYLLRCSGCHGTDGAGTTLGGIPPLPGYVGHIAADADGRTYLMHVPGIVGSGLDDAAIAGVMNYVLDVWADASATRFTEAEVARRRAETVPDIVAFRRAIVARLERKGIALAEYPWP